MPLVRPLASKFGQSPDGGRSPVAFTLESAGQSHALYLAFCLSRSFNLSGSHPDNVGGEQPVLALDHPSLYVRSDLSSSYLFLKVERYLMASPAEMSLHTQG